MASSFKAYMAGVGTVAVAIVLGFGGGLLIAQRFGSDTAVPEQSKITKSNQDTKPVQDAKPNQGANETDAPQIPASKPVVTETVGSALNNQPLTPAPQSLTRPAAAPDGRPVQQAPSQQAEHPPQQRALDNAPVPPRETLREPTTAHRQQIIPVDEGAEAATVKRRAEKAASKSARRQARKSDMQQQRRAQQRRLQDEDVRRAQARATDDDEEEIEDVSSRSSRRAEEPMAYRRTAPQPMPLPFFGLFGGGAD